MDDFRSGLAPDMTPYVTPEQATAVIHRGNFFLVACPGSGKTRTAGARVATLVRDGKRVAATSYTNVGAEAIGRALSKELETPVPGASYLGTLHGFLLRFVYYPFGHLVMKCKSRPRVIGATAKWDDVIFDGDNSKRAPISAFRFLPDGTVRFHGRLPLGVANREDATHLGQDRAVELKLRAAEHGWATPDDCMYWAFRALAEHPELAASVAARFDELLVDEAQDTSDIQLACIDTLLSTDRLASLVLVGDLDQSIYGFNGACPDEVEALVTRHAMETLTLNENHRSSQKICDMASRFSSRPHPDKAVGETAECPWAPELLLYDPEAPETAVIAFRRRVERLGLDETAVAVLTRQHDLAQRINGDRMAIEFQRHLLALGRVGRRILEEQTLTRGDIERVERLMAYLAWGADLDDLDSDQRRAIRLTASFTIKGLPPLAGNLKDWVVQARTVAGEAAKTLAAPLANNPGPSLQARAEFDGVDAESAFGAAGTTTLRAQTIHDIKGETREGVLVVTDKKRGRHDAQGTLWGKALAGEEISSEDAEELRIAFVSLTRARKYCMLALPSDTDSAVLALFTGAGFERLDD
jgi:DNA helicase-2/ATP-dependent DNA helicase PcrA